MIFFAFLLAVVRGAIVINEIMYHHALDEQFEYVELFNAGGPTTDISGWRLSGVNFTLPAGTTFAANDYIIIAANKAAFLRYWTVPASKVFGDFLSNNGSLNNGGDTLTLRNAVGVAVYSVTYNDRKPWPVLPDGGGPSLELRCPTADPRNWYSWVSSPASVGIDLHTETTGTPGAANSFVSCPALEPPHPRVIFTEIMYKPVRELGIFDEHEYVELYNYGSVPVDLSSYRVLTLKGGARFTFPPGSTIAPLTAVIVAKNVAEWRRIYNNYTSVPVFGPFSGGIGTGDVLVLVDDSNYDVESVKFDDKFPYPLAAGGLGVDNDMLLFSGDPHPAADWGGLNYTQMMFKGMSLQLRARNIGRNGDDVGRWDAWLPSPGALTFGFGTGRNNASTYVPVVESLAVVPADGSPVILNTTRVNITIGFTPKRSDLEQPLSFEFVRVGYFLDDPINGTVMIGGVGGPLVYDTCVVVGDPFDSTFRCNLPTFAANSIIRYRIEYRMIGQVGTATSLSPRPTETIRYHAYFVDPNIPTTTPVYHFFINRSKWQTLFDTANGGRCNGCALRSTWGSMQPTVLVYNGVVMDVMTRFQGSRYNRMNGWGLNSSVPFRFPEAPNPFRAWSWRFAIPPYAPYKGGDVITLQKMFQGCTHLQTALMSKLQLEAGMMASDFRYVRSQVNGVYYRYQIEVDHGGSAYINKKNDVFNARCLHKPQERLGVLFKAQGFGGYECGYGPGTLARLTGGSCGYTELQTLTNTIGRKTHRMNGTDGHVELLNDIIIPLNALNVSDVTSCYNWLNSKFDLDRLSTNYVLYNFGQAWDDNLHNYYPYQRLTDGKWFILPWDADRMFGEAQGWANNGSPYAGDDADGSTAQKPWNNRLKHYVMRCARSVITQKFHLLLNTVLVNTTTVPWFNAIVAQFNTTEANAAWGGFGQNFATCETNIRNFLNTRPARVLSMLTEPAVRTTFTPDDFCMNTPTITTRLNNPYSAAPGAPVALTADSVSDSRISLSWVAPNPNGSPISSYTVERRWLGNATFVTLATVTASSSVTPVFVDTAGVAPDVGYEYRVRAFSMSKGLFSQYALLQVTTPLAGAQFQVPVVINEVLANSGASLDFVELYNPTGIAADISGWRLMDDLDNIGASFVIPAGTILPPFGYISYNETRLGFRLSSSGEQVFLVRTSALGAQTGYIHRVSFGASAIGEALGRTVLSTGEEIMLRQTAPTPGAANAGAAVGPIVIYQIGYQRANSTTEYIVLRNVGASSVTLALNSSFTYRIDGIGGYNVPAGVSLAPGADYYIANVAPAVLRTELGLPMTTLVSPTPFTGGLQDDGERIVLQVPTIENNFVIWAELDWVSYRNTAPWPTVVNATGIIVRLAPNAKDTTYAIAPEPLNWGRASPICAPACQNGGLCVRANVCDCSGTMNYTGLVCDRPPFSCGDGIVQGFNMEECDGGPCCTSMCLFEPTTKQCRDAVPGGCDVAEKCTGASSACPADLFVAAGTECRAAIAGGCDIAEVCTGTAPTCPVDTFQPSTVVCRAASTPCDAAEFCTGLSSTCGADTFAPTTQVCRAATGPCDLIEYCTGTGKNCPADVLRASGVPCRAAAGPCDVAESCTGSSAACPADVLVAANTQCRAAADVCDIAARCTGASASCPANGFRPSTTLCRNATGAVCDAAEFCTGNDAACPPNALAAPGFPCNDSDTCTSMSTCSPVGVCSGVKDSCFCDTSADCNDGNPCTVDVCVKDSNGSRCSTTAGNADTVCRAAVDVCDVEERCTGSSIMCPADVFRTGIMCRAASGLCDLPATCSGASAVCPPNPFRNSSHVCRPTASTLCDGPERCSGSSAACPADGPAPNGTPCDDGDTCTSTSTCAGFNTCVGVADSCSCNTNADCDDGNPCTVNMCVAKAPNGRHCVVSAGNMGALCRAAAGPCDLEELCTGTSMTCPADVMLTSGTCRAAADACDLPASCNGLSPNCPPNPFRMSSFLCRAVNATKLCDGAEYCTGSSAQCPPDNAPPPANTMCEDNDICTFNSTCAGDQLCSGVRNACPCSLNPMDFARDCDDKNPCTEDTCITGGLGTICQNKATMAQRGLLCRAAATICDVAETCDGTNDACPVDAFAPATTMCSPATGDCDLPAMCRGNSAACGSHPFKPSTVECRAQNTSVVCDAAEFCTGSSAMCPPNIKAAAGVACDDRDGCTSTSQCTPTGTCVGVRDACLCTTDANCNDNNPCTLDKCEFTPTNGTVCTNKANMTLAGTTCRAAAGPCDVAEVCSGTSVNCPADVFEPMTKSCRAAAGVCDLEAFCTGSAALCPANAFRPNTHVCRPAAVGVLCDAPEFCAGFKDCPVDVPAPIGTPCDDGNICTSKSACQGLGVCRGQRDSCTCEVDDDCNDSNPCSVDKCLAGATGKKCEYFASVANEGKVCRPAAGPCDRVESCTADSPLCPADQYLADVVCRNATASPCDIEETCDGTSAQCPSERYAGRERLCRASKASCDASEFCDGASPDCPADGKLAFGAPCRNSTGPCDAVEVCDGISVECPANVDAVDGSACDDGDECTLSSVCRAGECAGARAACDCMIDSDCDDENDCTIDQCKDRSCKHSSKELGVRCDDGDPCSFNDRCRASGRCEGVAFCLGTAQCLRPGPYCQCSQGFSGLRCEVPACNPADLCGKHGRCEFGNKCSCAKFWEGERCDKYTGPAIESPSTPIRRLEDIKLDEFSWNKDLGGGLYGWTVAAIAGAFLVLCIITLVVVAFLLNKFIVDPVDRRYESARMF